MNVAEHNSSRYDRCCVTGLCHSASRGASKSLICLGQRNGRAAVRLVNLIHPYGSPINAYESADGFLHQGGWDYGSYDLSDRELIVQTSVGG